MTQKRLHSLVETVASTVVGFLLSMLLTALVMPAFGYHVTTEDNLAITTIFTAASVLRGYAMRRLFNHLGRREAAP